MGGKRPATVRKDIALSGKLTRENAALAARLTNVKAPKGTVQALAAAVASLSTLNIALARFKHAVHATSSRHRTARIAAAQTAVIIAVQGVRSTTETLGI